MQPCVITTGLVRFTWDIYSMMQMSWTMITVALDTAVVIVIAVLGVQHHPAVTKYESLTTGKHKQTNKQTNSKVKIDWKYKVCLRHQDLQKYQTDSFNVDIIRKLTIRH
jgi:hypothetical protein